MSLKWRYARNSCDFVGRSGLRVGHRLDAMAWTIGCRATPVALANLVSNSCHLAVGVHTFAVASYPRTLAGERSVALQRHGDVHRFCCVSTSILGRWNDMGSCCQ